MLFSFEVEWKKRRQVDFGTKSSNDRSRMGMGSGCGTVGRARSLPTNLV